MVTNCMYIYRSWNLILTSAVPQSSSSVYLLYRPNQAKETLSIKMSQPSFLTGAGVPAYEILEEQCKPSILRTKGECRKAKKKLAKEQRRGAKQLTTPTAPSQAYEADDVGLQYGQFERHTRGIGSKLMAQMGYLGAGTGLGREKQGIAEPVKAAHRPKKLGLGAWAQSLGWGAPPHEHERHA